MRTLARILAVALVTGCSNFPMTPDPPAGPTLLDATITRDVRRAAREHPPGPASVSRRAEVADADVIDVHTHTFNARYLPIQNILLGKRDVSPWGVLLLDEWARKIAAAVTSATELAPVPGVNERLDPIEATHRVAFGPAGASYESGGEGEASALEELGRALREVYAGLDTNDAASVDQALESLDELIEETLERERFTTLRKALEKLHDLFGGPSYAHFLVSLLSRDDLQIRRFRGDFQGDPDVDLAVSHMMDLAPVYGQKEDSVLLEPFVLGQIPRIAENQKDPAARMIYFVAYNPFRDNGGRGAASIRIVEDAIENRGAWGVKVYPPSGYRPARNTIPMRPFTISPEPRRQWDARYEGLTNEQLDRRLDALFAYCAENDVPIFTHSSPGEFEARKGYSIHMADPRWWRPVLEKYPGLRLCFGHAGGSAFWFGLDSGHESWGRLVYEYCVTYENVYCEFGVHAEVAKPEQRAFFVSLLRHLVAHPRPGAEFRFEKKILYGSDWFMPREANPQYSFLDAYREAFLTEDLIDHYEDFFARNALRYLDADARSRRDRASFPESVRRHLDALVDRAAPASNGNGASTRATGD